MKKIILGLTTLLFLSCGNNYTDFSGKWIDKRNESDIMTISKNGKNYIVETKKSKYPAQIKDDLLEISTKIPTKATIDDKGILIVSGNEYIKYENATKPKFSGIWQQENKDKPEYHIWLNQYGHLKLELLNNEPWKEHGHWGERKKLSNINYKDGHLTFRILQKIDYNYRKWNMDLSLDNDKINLLETEINSPYGNVDSNSYTFMKIK